MAATVQETRVLKRLLAQDKEIDSLIADRSELSAQIGAARKEFNGIMAEGETSPGNEADVLKRLTTKQHQIDKLVERRTDVSNDVREAKQTFDQIMGEADQTASGQIDAFEGQTFHDRGRGKKTAKKTMRAGKHPDMSRSVSKRAKSKAARKR